MEIFLFDSYNLLSALFMLIILIPFLLCSFVVLIAAIGTFIHCYH